MKIKGIVTFALILSLFLAANIILFGKVEIGKGFFVMYFMLALFLLLLLGVALKKVFTKSDKIIFGIAIVIMAVFIALFAQGVKDYMVKNQQVNEAMGGEVTNLTQMNQFYVDYANYLGQQILNVRKDSQTLQNQIDVLKNQLAQQQNQQQNQAQTNTSTIYINPPSDDGKEQRDD